MVLMDERERGARDRLLDAVAVADGASECRLPGSELSGEREEQWWVCGAAERLPPRDELRLRDGEPPVGRQRRDDRREFHGAPSAAPAPAPRTATAIGGDPRRSAGPPP